LRGEISPAGCRAPRRSGSNEGFGDFGFEGWTGGLRARTSRVSGAMFGVGLSSERAAEISRRPGRDPYRADSSGTRARRISGFAPGIDVNAT